MRICSLKGACSLFSVINLERNFSEYVSGEKKFLFLTFCEVRVVV